MSLSRTALVLGFLVLNACSVGTVTASSAHDPAAPAGGLSLSPQGNTPTSGERPQTVERVTTASHAEHTAEPRSFGFTCRRCYH